MCYIIDHYFTMDMHPLILILIRHIDFHMRQFGRQPTRISYNSQTIEIALKCTRLGHGFGIRIQCERYKQDVY